jgi:lipid A 3-O-deacylase
MAGASLASAQVPASSDAAAVDPVAHVRDARSWEYGPFLNYGTGVGDRSDYKFFWGGFQLGKPLTPVVHAGIFSGQFELSGNVMPLWQAYTPRRQPADLFYPLPGGGRAPRWAPFGGGTYRGVSLTPVIFRWNFPHQLAPLPALVSGCGRAHLHHPQVSANQLVPHGNCRAALPCGIFRRKAVPAFITSSAPSGPSIWA